jgi:hypothetical protein
VELLIFAPEVGDTIISSIPPTPAVRIRITTQAHSHVLTTVWTIGLIDESDVGTTWTLDESTAAGFGFDWQNALDIMLFQEPPSSDNPNTGINESDTYHTISAGIAWSGVDGAFFSGGQTCCLNSPIMLDRVEYTLLDYTETAETGNTVRYRAVGRLAAYGAIPEPSSAMLLTIGLLLIHQYAPDCRRYRCRT